MLRADGDPELRVFDPVIRSLHWLTLFLVITIFALAFSIEFASSREAVALIQLHRSFGVTVWVVTLGRLVWRLFARFPNWPADMPQPMRLAAQWSEHALCIARHVDLQDKPPDYGVQYVAMKRNMACMP